MILKEWAKIQDKLTLSLIFDGCDKKEYLKIFKILKMCNKFCLNQQKIIDYIKHIPLTFIELNSQWFINTLLLIVYFIVKEHVINIPIYFFARTNIKDTYYKLVGDFPQLLFIQWIINRIFNCYLSFTPTDLLFNITSTLANSYNVFSICKNANEIWTINSVNNFTNYAIDSQIECSICMTNKWNIELTCWHTLCNTCITNLTRCPFCWNNIVNYTQILN